MSFASATSLAIHSHKRADKKDSWPFLCECFDRARVRHALSVADILTFLFKSPVYKEDRRDLLAEGLRTLLVLLGH